MSKVTCKIPLPILQDRDLNPKNCDSAQRGQQKYFPAEPSHYTSKDQQAQIKEPLHYFQTSKNGLNHGSRLLILQEATFLAQAEKYSNLKPQHSPLHLLLQYHLSLNTSLPQYKNETAKVWVQPWVHAERKPQTGTPARMGHHWWAGDGSQDFVAGSLPHRML